jgi:hypothetical protein
MTELTIGSHLPALYVCSAKAGLVYVRRGVNARRLLTTVAKTDSTRLKFDFLYSDVHRTDSRET